MQGLFPERVEPPLPPQRHRLHRSGSFELVEPDIVDSNTFAPEVNRIMDLEAKVFVIPFNPPLTEPHDLVLVQISTSQGSDYISNPSLQWFVMENIGNVSGSRGPHTPMPTTVGG
jgi:hypothetical protein